MGRFAFKRFLQMIPTLFFVMLVIFSLMKLIPGDPALTLLGPEASPADIAAFREELGLNKPLPVQFLTYLRNVAHGDLGRSLIYRADVLTLIKERLPTTLALSLSALSLAILLGVPLGSWDKGLWNVVSHFILPSCALAFQSVGTIARFTRSSMLEVLKQD